jgi:hypothetical protein
MLFGAYLVQKTTEKLRSILLGICCELLMDSPPFDSERRQPAKAIESKKLCASSGQQTERAAHRLPAGLAMLLQPRRHGRHSQEDEADSIDITGIANTLETHQTYIT